MEKNHRTPLVSGSASKQSAGSSRRSSSWLGTSTGSGSGSRLMRDLEEEEDAVDRDNLDDEMHFRQHNESTCRRNIMRMLDSNPMQVLLYVLVVLDAGVVITEILLDLHAMRSQYKEATADLLEAIDFLKEVYSQDLNGYSGDNIHYILDTLRRKRPTDDAIRLPLHPSCPNSSSPDSFPYYSIVNRLSDSGVRIDAAPQPLIGGPTPDHRKSTGGGPRPRILTTRADGEEKKLRRAVLKEQRPEIPVTANNEAATFSKFSTQTYASVMSSQDTSDDVESKQLNIRRSSKRPLRLRKRTAKYEHRKNRTGKRRRRRRRRLRRRASVARPATIIRSDGQNWPPTANSSSSFSEINSNSSDGYYRKYSYAANLLKIAHMLHYVGIGILGIFVVQVFLKLYGMSCEFFRKKLELFDAVIVLTSFSLDLVFVEGITGEQNEEAIALLIIFLLWRILRIINGIMVTSKKRQDLLIQLQKRARRRAEKKMEYLETDRTWKEREIHNLRDLCTERGATEEDISRCKPRRRTILQKMDTSLGLSSIATLSLGLSMSMAGAGRAVIRTLGTVPGSLDGRQGLQQLLGVPLVPRSGARRSTLGLSGSYQASKKWRRNLLSRKTAKSKVGGDGAAVENSTDIITSTAGGQRGDVEEDKTTTRTNGSDYTAIDAVQVDERFEQAAESNANAIVVADGRILGSSSKLRTGSVYLRALIPDFIVHVTGAQEDNKQYDAPELIPDQDPKKEPDRPHNRTNSAERRRRNRHLLGSRNPPPIFSSSLPQLSLARLATNNNNIVVKNTCNYSLSSIGCSRSSSSSNNNNNNSNNQLQQVLNRENDERRRQFRLAGSENIDLEIINSGRISEDTRPAGHVVYANSTTPPAAATTTCASKVDLALSASCGSPPPSSCLSGSSSTQSSELALVENQSRQTPIVDGQKRVLTSCQDAVDGVEWSAAAATGAANETGSVRPKSKRPSVGFWRCSKSQEIQPRENISSATGFKTRHKSIHSMTKSHDFF